MQGGDACGEEIAAVTAAERHLGLGVPVQYCVGPPPQQLLLPLQLLWGTRRLDPSPQAGFFFRPNPAPWPTPLNAHRCRSDRRKEPSTMNTNGVQVSRGDANHNDV